MSHLLEVKDLEVKFDLRFGDLTAINGVNFVLDRGERLGIVGESGAGKSVTGFAIINLLSKPGYISAGQVLFEGLELNRLPEEGMRKIRGNRISMIFRVEGHHGVLENHADAVAADFTHVFFRQPV